MSHWHMNDAENTRTHLRGAWPLKWRHPEFAAGVDDGDIGARTEVDAAAVLGAVHLQLRPRRVHQALAQDRVPVLHSRAAEAR